MNDVESDIEDSLLGEGQDTEHKPLFEGLEKISEPLIDRVIAEAQEGSLNTLLNEIENYRSGNWDLRAEYIELAASHWPLGICLSIEICPDTAVGNLIRGQYFAHCAWSAIGNGYSDTIPQNAWSTFRDGIGSAFEAFMRASEQDPEDPTPHMYLSTPISMGLPQHQQIHVAERAFESALDKYPGSFKAHIGRLQLMCKKWVGSHEFMFDFARTTIQNAPVHSLLKVVLLHAFNEYWQALKDGFGGFSDTVLPLLKCRHPAEVYAKDPEVVHETRQIYAECLENHTISNYSEAQIHADAIWWLFLVGDNDACRREMKKLWPWSEYYMNEEMELILDNWNSLDNLRKTQYGCC